MTKVLKGVLAVWVVWVAGCERDSGKSNKKMDATDIVIRDTAGQTETAPDEGGTQPVKTNVLRPNIPLDEDAASATPIKTGRICIAPLDDSPTPGKGRSVSVTSDVQPRSDGSPSQNPTPLRFEKRIAVLGDTSAEYSTRDGAFFDGLDLQQPYVLLLKTTPSGRPYARYKIDFARMGTNILCVYNNAFYDTHQISETPRRPYCKNCFNEFKALKTDPVQAVDN